jgi:hypothetical protein
VAELGGGNWGWAAAEVVAEGGGVVGARVGMAAGDGWEGERSFSVFLRHLK